MPSWEAARTAARTIGLRAGGSVERDRLSVEAGAARVERADDVDRATDGEVGGGAPRVLHRRTDVNGQAVQSQRSKRRSPGGDRAVKPERRVGERLVAEHVDALRLDDPAARRAEHRDPRAEDDACRTVRE